MAETTRILVLGATGYIGGSLLTELLELNGNSGPRWTLSALVRKQSQASILANAGVNPLIFKDLDDSEAIRAAAKDHDIVIAAASARHAECVKACMRGLGGRGKSNGKATHYIHVSGASNVGDWPVTGSRIDTSVHSDVKEDIYEFERTHTESFSPVRDVNQLVVEQGEEDGVKTYIVIPPLIFGPGTGLFTLGIGQVHQMTQLALKNNKAVMLGTGSGTWNRVHILDLSHLFFLLVEAILDQKLHLPSGKTGYYFAENGFQSWKSIAENIGQIGHQFGAFETDEVVRIELQEVADEFYGGNLIDAEAVLGSNSRTKADRARHVLGWKPKRGEEDFLQETRVVVTAMIREKEKFQNKL
ncbi:hypothetical protein LSUE1_G002121 [Lachnellula suecica]|uniref:NAD(P)-binding domain-containing protein n=1 Tax=Lachnellula suecica TaxID=602035 RepID=A0A8T9CFZ6_9HELO|nr:hypothetical protein LSUE1_G002121 [Lachnellula suecica]